MPAPRRSVLSRVSRWVAVTSLLVGAACTSSSSTVTSPTSARCPFELPASPATLDASSGTGQIAFTVNRECTWDARSESAWITLAASTSGQGEANLGYSVAANSQVIARRAGTSATTEPSRAICTLLEGAVGEVVGTLSVRGSRIFCARTRRPARGTLFVRRPMPRIRSAWNNWRNWMS